MSKTKKLLLVGTRRSALAKGQTNWVVRQLYNLHQHLEIKIKEVVTTGDKMLDTSLNKMVNKGVFVKEIEEQLLEGTIDIAVHSMKDLPTECPDGLTIAAFPERVDPRDVLVTRLKKNLEEMPEEAKIGTSSVRRKAQLLHFRRDLKILDIRGNIDTRLNKAETDPYDGIILAAAGLSRMAWLDRVQEYLSCSIMIPAVGQGALGIEVRENDEETRRLINPLNDSKTELTVKAERAFLEAMGGGCHTPMGAFCREREGKINFQAFIAEADGSNFKKHSVEGNLEDVMKLSEQLVLHLK